MRLVLSGYYGFYNVGDEAILQSIIESLSKENPDIELVVLSNDSKYTKEMYGVESVDRWDIKAVYHAIKNSDGVISGGGAFFKIRQVRRVFYIIRVLWDSLDY